MIHGKTKTEFGRLTPGEGGTLTLDVTGEPNRPAQKLVLTHEADDPGLEPRQENGAFTVRYLEGFGSAGRQDSRCAHRAVGGACETYVKNNPTLDSAQKLGKLLKRFDASRDWTRPRRSHCSMSFVAQSTWPIEAALKAPDPRTGMHRTA